MRTIFIILILLASLSIKSQTLTNPNFENWGVSSTYYTDTLPVNWWPFYCNTIHPTTDSYQGTYATKIQGWFACGIAPGVMVNGQPPVNYGEFMESGTPFTSKPGSVSGYYKYTDVTAGDSAEVTIILKRYNSVTMKRDTIAYATKALPPSSTYSMYTVNLNDLLPGVSPDSIIIMFNSSKYYLFDMITMALPVLYIDRIMMPEAPLGMEENSTILVESGIYPNPFSENAELKIEGEFSKYGDVSADVFDVTGKKVLNYDKISSNTLTLNKNRLSKGTYTYQVRNNKNLISRGKFIIQ